ncbi:MAG: hypothetical protein IKD22_03925 [Lentisphaeria bacterium]|nr:hypothetical protein [Lentisphaeria bacterium]
MMKNSLKFAALALCVCCVSSVSAGSATAPYNNSSIDGRLNFTIKPDTTKVHFIRDNNDPNVLTKTYVLKYADPYELRAYIRKIVQTRRVNDCNTNVKAIKYTDGTSILIISAEDYRFDDSSAGQGFDSIVRELDRPGITSSSGRPTYCYFPKYRSAAELQAMVSAIGANTNSVAMNTIGATDALANDPGLNMLFFKTAPFSQRNILNVLKEYDRPAPEVRVKVTVYELYAENDTKLGMDFQAWKNNDGLDLFATGARFQQNYAPDGSGLMKGGKWGDTKYFQFNPKWNTKYIDFLTSKGKARVIHSADMRLTNGKTGSLKRTTNVFLAVNEDAVTTDKDGNEVPQVKAIAEKLFTYAAPAAGQVVGRTASGAAVTVGSAGAKSTLTGVQCSFNGVSKTTLHLTNGYLLVGNVNAGRNVTVAECVNFLNTTEIRNDLNMPLGKVVNTQPSSREFGFNMALTPAVSGEATVLNVAITNSSLIGYKSNGEARIQQGAQIKSSFMISNAGTKLLIGGIEKRDVVRVSGGVPLLKDLPLLGWIFSTESESTKRSQLLVVLEVTPVKAGETINAEQRKEIEAAKKELSKAGKTNAYGYRQYGIDSSR